MLFINIKYKMQKEDNSSSQKDSTKEKPSEDLMSPKKKKHFNYLHRLEESEKRRKEKMAQLIEKTKTEENKKYLEKPQIYEKSQRLLKTTKSFLERMKEEEKEQKERKNKLIDTITEQRKKEEAEIFKRVNEINQRKISKEEWDKQLERMKENEKKNKEKFKKIEEKTKEEQMKECKFKPKIDKGSNKLLKSSKLHMRVNSATVVQRLYNEDLETRKDKKELLDKRYLPTFTPNLGKDTSDKKSHNSSSSFKKGYPVKKTKEFKNHYIMTASNNKVKGLTNIEGI